MSPLNLPLILSPWSCPPYPVSPYPVSPTLAPLPRLSLTPSLPTLSPYPVSHTLSPTPSSTSHVHHTLLHHTLTSPPTIHQHTLNANRQDTRHDISSRNPSIPSHLQAITYPNKHTTVHANKQLKSYMILEKAWSGCHWLLDHRGFPQRHTNYGCHVSLWSKHMHWHTQSAAWKPNRHIETSRRRNSNKCWRWHVGYQNWLWTLRMDEWADGVNALVDEWYTWTSKVMVVCQIHGQQSDSRMTMQMNGGMDGWINR